VLHNEIHVLILTILLFGWSLYSHFGAYSDAVSIWSPLICSFSLEPTHSFYSLAVHLVISLWSSEEESGIAFLVDQQVGVVHLCVCVYMCVCVRGVVGMLYINKSSSSSFDPFVRMHSHYATV